MEWTIACEVTDDVRTRPGDLADAIAASVRDVARLRADQVDLVAAGSLPNDGKVIDDRRKLD